MTPAAFIGFAVAAGFASAVGAWLGLWVAKTIATAIVDARRGA